MIAEQPVLRRLVSLVYSCAHVHDHAHRLYHSAVHGFSWATSSLKISACFRSFRPVVYVMDSPSVAWVGLGSTSGNRFVSGRALGLGAMVPPSSGCLSPAFLLRFQ